MCDRVAVLEHGRLLAIGTPSELARQLGRRLSLEIAVSPQTLPAALQTLAAMKADVSDRGDALVIGGIDREKVPELVATLVTAGVRIYRVAPQEPSLEDVYFALHGETPEEPGREVRA